MSARFGKGPFGSRKAGYLYKAGVQKRARRRALGYRNRPRARIYKSTGEMKGMDTALTVAGPVINTTSTNGDCLVLNLVQAGNAYYNRIGRKIFLHSVRLSGTARYIWNAQTTTLNQGLAPLRMVVVWDKQPSSGTIPTFDTVFGNTVQTGTESTTVWDNLKFDNTGRFRVLRDCKIKPDPVVSASTGGTGNIVQVDVAFDEFIKLKKRTIFSGDESPMTIADISSGALYVYFRAIASSNDVTDWAIASHSVARLRYTDI